MAPEVMRGLNHTGSVDYFAVGIITYELMLGKRPYLGKSRKEIREQMMIKQIFLEEQNIPVGWSHYAADFVNRLLLRKDSSRLGFYNDLEVKRHPWLRSINFNDLINYKIEAPFLPRKNHDNYDKKYCQEIEEIGIDTNLRYEEYRNNERYIEIFEGFTFYNVDESKLIQYNNEIYKKPNVKYINNDLNNTNNKDYLFRKSKTINLDYDYRNKINQTPKQYRNKDLSQSRQNNNNISPIRNQNLSSYRNRSNINNISPIRNQNLSSYRNRSNISNRTINYSNVENNTNKQSSKISIKYNQNNSIINLNSKFPLKNREELYIMASPTKRGRITINSNDNNIDNSFRKYANHSFVETNYSKGKIFRRSYSSTNLHNSNYINIFNLLVNNVNNMNNNNTIKNNDKAYSRDIYGNNNSKLFTPISYNKINKGSIPYDRRPNSSYKNYNNFNINNNDIYYHHHNRSFIEKPKNYSFYFVDNDNIYNYSNICNNYSNYNNYEYKENTFRYRNRNLNKIFNQCYEEESKNYSNQKEGERDKYKELKNNNYSFQLKEKIPIGNTTRLIPVKINDRSLPNNNTINIDYSTRSYKNINYNKMQYINNINIRNIPNNFLYIDKYEKKDFIKEENKNNENPKENRKIFNYKMDDKSNHINIINSNQSNNIHFFEKNINKRNSEIIKNYSYGNININSMNNNLSNSNINSHRNINNSKKNKKEKNKNASFKKIPIPVPLSKTLRTKKVEIIDNDESNKKISISKINIINNNIINNNLINNPPINYNNKYYGNNSYLINQNIKNKNINKDRVEISDNTKNINKNIKSNNINNINEDRVEINNNNINDNINYNLLGISLNNRQNNISNSKIINKNNDIISMRINEKTFGQYKYLENFDKYKKIKNINDRNKNKYINKDIYKNNNQEIRKKKIKNNNNIIMNKERIK